MPLYWCEDEVTEQGASQWQWPPAFLKVMVLNLSWCWSSHTFSCFPAPCIPIATLGNTDCWRAKALPATLVTGFVVTIVLYSPLTGQNVASRSSIYLSLYLNMLDTAILHCTHACYPANRSFICMSTSVAIKLDTTFRLCTGMPTVPLHTTPLPSLHQPTLIDLQPPYTYLFILFIEQAHFL